MSTFIPISVTNSAYLRIEKIRHAQPKRKAINDPQDHQLEMLRKRLDPTALRYEGKPKFKYLLPLDDEIGDRINSSIEALPERATSKGIVGLDSIQERAV